MRIRTVARILSDLSRRGLRTNYWEFTNLAARVARLREPGNGPFRRRVVGELAQYVVNRPRPIHGAVGERVKAAAEWLMRAQDAGPDDGVSQGYFPCDGPHPWRPSYPETTGYIISSLLEYSARYADAGARSAALRMARWEIGLQMKSGAVQAGTVRPAGEQSAAVFNTGMVLDGWCSAYNATGDREFLLAADRAAKFLLADLGDDGHFRTHGTHVVADRIKTYNCLCAWALYRHGLNHEDGRYQTAAVRNVEAAIGQQSGNGWFDNNCLTRRDAPLLHTIGYALQGILEVGILAKRSDFINAAMRGADPVLARMSPTGFLHGRFYSDWEPAVFSSCLTGSAQLAVVCYRLAQVTGVASYRAAADRILGYLKPLQALGSPELAMNGALGGSFPLLGGYMTAGYPNWATKYLLDALMLQDDLG